MTKAEIKKMQDGDLIRLYVYYGLTESSGAYRRIADDLRKEIRERCLVEELGVYVIGFRREA